jgi:hypothetical protein
MSSKTRTGTRSAGGTATPPIRVRLTKKRSPEKASTVARKSGAKSGTRVTTSTTASGSRSGTSTELPATPRVDIGPKAYKRYKDRSRLVIRFFVAEDLVRWRGAYHGTGRFFVYDMESRGKIAGKTSKDGYATEQEAVKVAREYRDKYGAYTRFKF